MPQPMSKKQKVILGLAIGAFALTLLSAPWVRTFPGFPNSGVPSYQSIEMSELWNPPERAQLAVGNLFAEWVAIGVISGGLLIILRGK